MIGILRKDLSILAVTYLKNLLLVFLTYAVVCIATDSLSLAMMVPFLMCFYSLSLISMDEASGWDRYVRTLPVSCGTVIAARFLTTLVMFGFGVLWAAGLGLIQVVRQMAAADELLVAFGAVTGFCLLIAGLLLPAAYRWGVEKARNTFLLLFALCFTVPLLFKDSLSPVLRTFFESLERLSPALITLIPLAAGIAVFLLGGVLSAAIYRKKEF